MIRLSNTGSDNVIITTDYHSIVVTKDELKNLCDMSKTFFAIKWPDDFVDEVYVSLERDIDSIIVDDNRERANDMAKEFSC